MIDASGGEVEACSRWVGSGGGGRIALYVDDLTTFDPSTQARSWGGAVGNCDGTVSSYGAAGAGTVYVMTPEMTYGELHVDNGLDADGDPRPGPDVALPSLGSGDLSLVEEFGDDAWVTGSQPFRPRWQGSYMELADSLGVRLGSFRVVETDSAGRALLSDASNVTSATTYRGEYRFDATMARNQTKLVIPDSFRSAHFEVQEGELRLPARVALESMTIREGGMAAASGPELSLAVAGALIIEEGGLLDASAQGYAGASSASTEGGSPDWVLGSTRDYGGSHGGLGTYRNYSSGQQGEIYGSVYLPQHS
ncbi:MAG: hypothetical protein K8H90_02030, partial [Thermoanaerobaculia bacterium]|nr:hypothetical protein [Thermoanaerobaculia bacterium]